MVELENFKKYMLHNSISEEVVRKSIDFFQLEKFPTNSYIIKQGEPAKRFYIILKGKVSIRVRKKKQKEERFIRENVRQMTTSGKKVSFNKMAKKLSGSSG